MPPVTCIFDAYGTLFDVRAAVRAVAAEPGQEVIAAVAGPLAGHWRAKQLTYSWLRSLMGRHADFRQVTAEALDHALEVFGLSDPGLAERLMLLYDRLDTYPEVPAMLRALKAQGHVAAILSNGSPAMLASATASAGIADLFDAVLSVEAAGVYKPDPRVYDLVGARFGVARDRVLFVSANGWDAAGAAAYGFRSLWVNREGEAEERLPARAEFQARDLAGVPEIAARL